VLELACRVRDERAAAGPAGRLVALGIDRDRGVALVRRKLDLGDELPVPLAVLDGGVAGHSQPRVLDRPN
jgi:hypothetical protein